MFKKAVFATAAISAVMSANVLAESARDYISIVGSSTVYPFATVVAEQFGKTTKYKTPKIESTGSGGGLKLFCAGIGVQHPDITNASRAIKKSEFDTCQKNGVKDIVQIKIGYDGIAVANAKSAEPMSLTRRDLFLALAKQVPGKNGKLIDNPYKSWHDVNPALPNTKIEVLGPPPTSGTRDAFSELVLGAGAKSFSDLKHLRKAKGDDVKKYMKKLGIPMNAYNKKGKKVFKAVAHAIREDGAYIEAGENDNLIVQKLEANPKALGIFGYSYLEQNADKIQGSKIEGVSPTFDTIGSGEYPVSRPLFFYVKKAHVGVIPGMKEYLAEFTSNKAFGEEGYLSDKGLIPMSNKERNEIAKAARDLTPMSM